MSKNVKAILWALFATAIFTIVATMAKIAVKDYHFLQILLFRQIVVFLSTLPTLLRTLPDSLKTPHPLLHSARLLGSFVALTGGILAVKGLPLTNATTLGFSTIFFVALLAALFLNEPLGPHRLGAILIGFIGVLIAVRPDASGLQNPYSLVALAAAFGGAVAAISVRKLSQTESTATLLVYQALFVGLLAAIPLFVPMFWPLFQSSHDLSAPLWKQPDLTDTVFLFSMGILSAIGQWIAIHAMRLGEAALVKSVDYVKLLYAALFGFIFFAEVPDEHTLAGAGLIILASLYILHREARLSRRARMAAS
ncbi:DMT family transporter [uncultured Cohaesibacter sp.]|uniref:DMT family transporter n=1 Tax=uncultured Cohaesibacter sp. TaxID=1002546 RepID=UPI0029C666CE|nr:DMT family transporter [uncultured Cohaesibacter sp.]